MINAALIAWPILIFILARSLPWQNTVVAALIGGFLLLPEQGGLDLPLLPPLEKDTIPCLVLFFLALILKPGVAPFQGQGARPAPGQDAQTGPEASVLRGWMPRSAIGQILLVLVVIGALMTALTNSDPLRFADTFFTIQGLTLYDGLSMVVTSVGMVLPILLGRKYLADPKGHRLLLIGLVLFGLFYSLLALIEIRLSPQMNRWVYGFFPHSWHQHLRGGGFRPLVFLQHGLLLAIFFSMTILAAFGLSRADTKARILWLLAGVWLLMTLVLANSLGALVIAVLLLPAVLIFPLRMQLLTAGLIAGAVLSFPLVRGAGLVPTEQLVSYAQSYSDERARSLQFRFEHEDSLLERANERPLFGWGPRGRNRVYDEQGRDQSVVDGAWIVSIGQGGWLRYLSEFGLLSVPLILFALGRRRYQVDQATATLCLVLAANMIDLIPNAGWSTLTWLIVGALLGRLELGRATELQTQAKPQAQAPPDVAKPEFTLTAKPLSPYTRQSAVHQRQQKLKKS